MAIDVVKFVKRFKLVKFFSSERCGNTSLSTTKRRRSDRQSRPRDTKRTANSRPSIDATIDGVASGGTASGGTVSSGTASGGVGADSLKKPPLPDVVPTEAENSFQKNVDAGRV